MSLTKNQVNPLVSIIIVVYNGANFIGGAIESVVNQDYPNLELIIIDGNSSDETMEIVKNYGTKIDIVLSEPDRGIYDAMNKGLILSRGDWIYFLGSDDELISNTVISSIFCDKCIDLNDADIVFGNVKSDGGNTIKSSFGLKLLLHNTLHHQSAFYKASLFKDFEYDTSLKMLSDYELNLKAYFLRNKALNTRKIVAVCREGGFSTNKDNFNLFMKETNFVRNKYVSRLCGYILTFAFELKCRIHNVVRYL